MDTTSRVIGLPTAKTGSFEDAEGRKWDSVDPHKNLGFKTATAGSAAIYRHRETTQDGATSDQYIVAFKGTNPMSDNNVTTDVGQVILGGKDDGLNILRAIRKIIPDNGTLLIAEPMAGTIGAEAMGDAYFGFYLLAMGRGRSRTTDELTALLKTAGFRSVKIARTRMPLQTKLLMARP